MKVHKKDFPKPKFCVKTFKSTCNKFYTDFFCLIVCMIYFLLFKICETLKQKETPKKRVNARKRRIDDEQEKSDE